MKKFLILVLSLLIFFLKTELSSAACTPPTFPFGSATPICQAGTTMCNNSNSPDNGLCCNSFPGECADATQTSTPTGSQTGGQAGSDVLCEGTGINTAIGCIHALGSQEEFLGDILKWAVGVGGGIAFLLIFYAGFMIMTSAGNPERLKAGQELLTSAISGLILLIFSIFILNFIGIDILGLGKFGFGQSQ